MIKSLFVAGRIGKRGLCVKDESSCGRFEVRRLIEFTYQGKAF